MTAALSGLAALSMGCAAEDAREEGVGEAEQAQLDPSTKDYLVYTITQGLTQRGKVLVTASSGGGYNADKEYWYLTSNISTGSSVTFTSGAGEYWSNPPSGLGTLSFTTERRPTWTSGTPSGTLLCETLSSGQKHAIDWQMSVSHGDWSGSITWWNSATGNMFGENQTNTLSPSSPPSGTWYYYVTQPL